MFPIHKIILLLTVYLTSYAVSWAVEFDIQAERTAWRYEEYAKDVSGYSGTLPSKAEGNGALLKLRLSTERDEDWFFGFSASMLDSSSWTNEVWVSQVNELTIRQEDLRLDIQYRMLGARFGLWVSERMQTQQRRNFLLNGVPTVPVGGEPAEEKIVSDWVGLSLTSVGGKMQQFETRIDAGMPVNVKVTNTGIAKPYTKKDGYRTGVHFRWTLPKSEVGVSGLNLTLRYEYQELGGENNLPTNFWPYNRWQMVAIGLLYAW